MSYANLINQARIAASLQQFGASPSNFVGEFISATLGTLVAGCGYIPMDPESAMDRLIFMASDASVEVILASKALDKVGLAIAKNIHYERHLIPISAAKSYHEPLHTVEISSDYPFDISSWLSSCAMQR